MIEVRFHGRGGQGAKIASRILGRSGFLCRLFAQDFALFGAERRGAPVVSFARLSTEPIDQRGQIDRPNFVVVMDDSLLKEARGQIFLGVTEQTPVFVNASQLPVNLKDPPPPADYVYIDLSSMAIDLIGSPFVSAMAAAVAAKWIPSIAPAALDEAIETELAEFGLPAELIHKNVGASREAYNRTPQVALPPSAEQVIERTLETPPYLRSSRFAGPTIRHPGSAALRETGNWRSEQPIIDLAKCKRCFLCYLYCPEAAIRLDPENFPHVDYDHCKGCMICYEECPTDAITRRREV